MSKKTTSPAVGPVRWLHLSDFHFRKGETWDQRLTLKALFRHLEKLKGEGLAPDLVFLTGDLAFSGKKEEFEQAEGFCRKLAEALDLDLAQRFFVIPGNHDVDRGEIRTMDRKTVASLARQEEIEEQFRDPAAMQLLGRRLEGFYAFTERLLGPARAWRADKPWRVDVREIRGVRVGVLQLNSAWASGPEDGAQRLLVGKAQVLEALQQAEDATLRLALVHHPLGDLRDWDQAPLETLLAAPDGAHVLLRGHLHRSRGTAHLGPDGSLIELAAGAMFPDAPPGGGEHPKGWFLGTADFAAGQLEARSFRYSSEGRGFWVADNQTYEGASDGVWRWALPESLRAVDPAGEAPGKVSAGRKATLTARYRAAAAAVHGTVRFVGFGDHRPRPNVQVPELFVPLRLWAEKFLGYYWTTSELLQRLQLPSSSTEEFAARIAVLGVPGSGKTTLCRFLTTVLAGKVADVPIERELLPLFLPFRDYLRSWHEARRQGSLLRFLEEQAETQFSLTLPEGFLEEALDDGQAVLLLDGLDEVGDATEREAMRDLVWGFCQQYPQTPVLITSRIAGYHDAPLRNAEGGFRLLELGEFSDSDLGLFVRHWYQVQEPADPKARADGIADLAAALAADPRVRELARNPMLATLIALVHRFEAHLPGERAKLYELCVKTLLETWPAARKRRFGEIDEGLQRAYLERLAFRMQAARVVGGYQWERTEHEDRGVTIGREELVTALTAIVCDQTGGGAVAEVERRKVERWVAFLAEGTGLLVEQRPGVFVFIHLSLMEYLAARGLEKVEPLVTAVVKRCTEPIWREVCLLAVGSHATEKELLDDLFEQLATLDSPPWSFLLACLREEAAFDVGQCEQILRGAGRTLLDCWSETSPLEQRLVADLQAYSLRHRKWLRAWLPRELATARGAELQGAVVLAGVEQENRPPPSLSSREDVSQAAADLLDFWPNASLSQWASTTADLAAMQAWGRDSAADLIILRTILAMSPKAAGEQLRSGLLLGLLGSAAAVMAGARRGSERVAHESREGGQGVPANVLVEPGTMELAIVSTWPAGETLREHRLPFYLAQAVALYFAGCSFDGFDRHLSRHFACDLSLGFAGYFARYFDLDFSCYFSVGFIRDFSQDFSRDFVRYSGRHFARSFSIEFAAAVQACSLCPPNTRYLSADLAAREAAMKMEDSKEAERYAEAVSTRLAAEAWIGLVCSHGAPAAERVLLIQRRVQHTWLLHLWPSIDLMVAFQGDPEAFALYLALGWTQATTTHQWPATELWIQRAKTRPEHWLPRSQWHLCWLLYDNDSTEHRQGLDAALAEGREDDERPGLAVGLAEVLGL